MCSSVLLHDGARLPAQHCGPPARHWTRQASIFHACSAPRLQGLHKRRHRNDGDSSFTHSGAQTDGGRLTALLSDVASFRHVTDYLGSGYWLYLSGTSKALRTAYASALVAADKANVRFIGHTTVTAAAASASALAYGLSSGQRLQKLLHSSTTACSAIGACGDRETIEMAIEDGEMPLNAHVMIGAARSRRPQLVCLLNARDDVAARPKLARPD